MNHVSAFALCLSSFVAIAAIGCSGAPDPIPTSSSKKASTAGSDTGTPTGTRTPAASNNSSSSPTTPAASTPLSDTSACGKKADAQTCETCCLAGTPTALDAANQAEGDCYCAAAACATQCAASVCATADNMNQPTAECGTCLDAHDMECAAKFDSTCNGDAACKTALACLTAQCDPLVPMSGGSSGSSGALPARANSFSARAMARSADPQ
jgi:hypothetical protein